MRITRSAVVGFVAGAIVTTAIAVPVTIAVSGSPTTKASAGTCPSESVSVTGTSARSYQHGLAESVLPLDTAKQIVGDQSLEIVDTDAPATCVYTALYRSPDFRALVDVQIYRATDAGIKAAYQSVVHTYATHKGEPYYQNATVTYWPTGPSHAMSSATYAYTVHTPKYGHDLVFANNGAFTVRIRVGLSNDNGALTIEHSLLFNLAEAAMKNSKSFK